MDATAWASVWVLVGLVIFIAICLYIKVPGMITKALDERAGRIRGELDDAQRLREEAQALLADYQKKRKEAEQEAAAIVEAAKNEASVLAEEAKKRTEDYVTRRTALAEQKIGQAEREAIAEVRSSAVDLAVEAARKVLGASVDGKVGADLFKSSLAEVKAKLN
ncbi:MAG: F0F1 ATP synthase subunit B [Mesorhizobium sp.]|nr:F0F1 ATP synthase subunit B [Mesorhizobium sp.]MBN9244603.1 F0F1 ATP synthase subunit B [Mesorhizobium sp.]